MRFRSGAPCKTGRRSEVTTVKIAVIGAGASGLFAASMLAKAGAEVTLFERNDMAALDGLFKKYAPKVKVVIKELGQR